MYALRSIIKLFAASVYSSQEKTCLWALDNQKCMYWEYLHNRDLFPYSISIIARSRPEPIFFTLTIPICENVCHKYIGKISGMDQNNSVFLYERGFIQPEMGILWQCIEKIWNWKNIYWNNVSRSMAKTSLGKRLYSQRNGDFRPCNSITYLKNRILIWE